MLTVKDINKIRQIVKLDINEAITGLEQRLNEKISTLQDIVIGMRRDLDVELTIRGAIIERHEKDIGKIKSYLKLK